MLDGIRIYSSDDIWRGILGELGAVIVDAPNDADIDIDTLGIATRISPMHLKALILDACDDSNTLRQVFGHDVTMPRIQARIVACLYKSGGMRGDQLKSMAGYSDASATHAVDTAIYQLRKKYGREFIINNDGVYSLGRI